jgi:hypothetical protein
MLMAIALVPAQPKPLKIAAMKSCHGACAPAQPARPTAQHTALALVTALTPSRL